MRRSPAHHRDVHVPAADEDLRQLTAVLVDPVERRIRLQAHGPVDQPREVTPPRPQL
jgi:hypothetical protein